MFYIKLGISLMIVSVSSYIGVLKSEKYKNRIIELREMKSALNIFKNKILFTYEPIGEIFKQIYSVTNENISQIFKDFLSKLENMPVSDSWDLAIEENINSFTKEDKVILKNFGRFLGANNKDGQISEIEMTNEFLNKQIENAEMDRNQNERLYRSLGVIIGIGISIILF